MHVRPEVRAPSSAEPRSVPMRRAGALLAVCVVLAGCGAAAPNDPGGGTGNPAPTQRPPSTGTLADVLPTEVGGQTLTVQSATGADGLALLPQADVAAITDQLDSLDLTPDRLSLAVAGDPAAANDEEGLAIIAVRVPGVLFTPSSGPQVTFVKNLLGVTGTARTARATLAGKTTTTFRQTTDDVAVTTYIYGPTEVIFIGRGPEALVEEAFSKVPERP